MLLKLTSPFNTVLEICSGDHVACNFSSMIAMNFADHFVFVEAFVLLCLAASSAVFAQ